MQDRKRTVCVRGVQVLLALTMPTPSKLSKHDAAPQSPALLKQAAHISRLVSTQLANVLRKLSRAQEMLYK
jgi:hypothetical protein